MLKAHRLSHTTLETPDLDRQVDYQVNVLGLRVADRTADRAVMTTALGQVALVMKRGSVARCTNVAFQVDPSVTIDDLASRLSEQGIRAERRTDDIPGLRETIAFQDPNGTTVDVFSRLEFTGTGDLTRGFTPLKLGHLAFKSPEIEAVSRFYAEVLGFKVSDWRGDFFVWMRCGPDHHTANFVRGPTAKLHHFAFELVDRAELLRACDILGQHGYQLVWGPGRHIIGDNIFAYHRDPDGNIVEFYTEMARIDSEDNGYFAPRPWRKDVPYKPATWGDGTLTNLWGPGPPPGFGD